MRYSVDVTGFTNHRSYVNRFTYVVEVHIWSGGGGTHLDPRTTCVCVLFSTFST